MLDVTADQIESSITAAKNSNAAIKNFLKKEVGNDDSLGRFAKDLRVAVGSGNPKVIHSFIEKNLPDREFHFLVLARYAHIEFITATVEKIVLGYADEFNETYEQVENGIKIKDQEKFSTIVNKVAALIDTELEAAKLPNINFMKKTIFVCVFEQHVLVEALKCVS